MLWTISKTALFAALPDSFYSTKVLTHKKTSVFNGDIYQ